MDTANGVTAPALTGLSRVIREYSLFQAVLLVIDRLREYHPELSDDELYEQMEFQANPSLHFTVSRHWVMVKRVTRPATFLTSFMIACSG